MYGTLSFLHRIADKGVLCFCPRVAAAATVLAPARDLLDLEGDAPAPSAAAPRPVGAVARRTITLEKTCADLLVQHDNPGPRTFCVECCLSDARPCAMDELHSEAIEFRFDLSFKSLGSEGIVRVAEWRT